MARRCTRAWLAPGQGRADQELVPLERERLTEQLLGLAVGREDAVLDAPLRAEHRVDLAGVHVDAPDRLAVVPLRGSADHDALHAEFRGRPGYAERIVEIRLNDSSPVIGGTLSTTVDGSNHPSAGLTLVLGYDVPLAGVNTPFGELLVANEPFGGVFAYGTVIGSGGGVAQHDSAVPNDITFVGIQLFSQGVILGGAGPELCNALDLVLGS